MVKMYEAIIGSVLGASCGILGTYLIAKKAFSVERLLDIFEDLTDEILTNSEYQKRIYVIGNLIGKGLIDGTGLKTASKGKKGLEGMIMEIIGNIAQHEIQKRINPQEQTQQFHPLPR